MKFLIVVALTFAAAQAAFTGSLVQQAQPLIQNLKLQSLARTSVEANLQTQLGNAINQHVTNTLNHIQQAIENVQNIAQGLFNSVGNAIQQGVVIGQQAVQQAQGLLANIISNILASFSTEKGVLVFPPILVDIIQSLAANQHYVNFVHSLPLYQCVIAAGVNLDYSHLVSIYDQGQAVAYANSVRPQVQGCMQAGGLTSVLELFRPYLSILATIFDALNIADVMHQSFVFIVGQDIFDQYVAPILTDLGILKRPPFCPRCVGVNKGLFGDVINGLSQGAQQLGSFVAGLAQTAVQNLQLTIEKIREMALAFVQSGLQSAQQLTLQAAQNLINFLQPIKDDLGLLYNQVIDQLSAIYSGLVLPF